jgi:chondroitin 4-sulfotransferase 11
MIDHDNKFIQVKISKCASTTVQKSINNDFNKLPFNYVKTEYELKVFQKNPQWIPHYHLLDQIARIEKDVLQDSKEYFKFTFVRNPWNRLVSQYFFATRFKNGINPFTQKPLPHQNLYKISFKEFIMNLEEIKMNTDWVGEQALDNAPYLKKLLDNKGFSNNCYDWISDENGKMLPMDFIGKFENLEEDYNKLAKLINCPILPTSLAKLNPSNHKHYTTYYDKDMIQVVNRLFEKDIETFKYKFEN